MKLNCIAVNMEPVVIKGVLRENQTDIKDSIIDFSQILDVLLSCEDNTLEDVNKDENKDESADFNLMDFSGFAGICLP